MPMAEKEQILLVTLHVRANDRDGYGIAKVAMPVSEIRWEGDRRQSVVMDDIYQVDVAVSEQIRCGWEVREIDLDAG